MSLQETFWGAYYGLWTDGGPPRAERGPSDTTNAAEGGASATSRRNPVSAACDTTKPHSDHPASSSSPDERSRRTTLTEPQAQRYTTVIHGMPAMSP